MQATPITYPRRAQQLSSSASQLIGRFSFSCSESLLSDSRFVVVPGVIGPSRRALQAAILPKEPARWPLL
jgi:hypothetical protein